MRLIAVACLTLIAQVAGAAAPTETIRPQMRQMHLSSMLDDAGLVLVPSGPVERAGTAEILSASLGVLSPRPQKRTKAVEEKAMAKRRMQRRGAVCGDLDIQGTQIGRVPGRISGCGIKDAVRVRAVAGVALTQEATIDCPTAKALKRWVDRGVKPAVGSYGGGLAKIKVVAHYACRTRNNQPGAKISEHGRGRAVDVAGFVLRDGSTISVLGDWGSGREGKILRKAHSQACGPFGTVLGPNSDRYHQDHIHVDTARYRSGSYCR